MYSRFVKILKFVQILNYVGALIFAGISTPIFPLALPYIIFFCLVNYITTQTIIAVIDLLNRIESNTRNSRQN